MALKCKKAEIFLGILCQDTNEWGNALEFIAGHPAPIACKYLEYYGPILLENLEDETVEVIKKLIVSKGLSIPLLS